MALLLPSTFQPAQVRSETRNTIIEDEPQVSIRRAPPHMHIKSITSPMSDDFPTPKAVPLRAASPASSDTQSHSSIWSKRTSTSSFDSMYDLSPSESEDVHIKLSHSVKRRIPRALQTDIEPMPIKIQLSPAVLKQYDTRIPSAAPSLATDLTSEESVPASPLEAWNAPIQLDPSAFSILKTISGEDAIREAVVEVTDAQEMREIVESPNRFGGLQLQTKLCVAAPTSEEFSALSIPSPSNFFSSLDGAARSAWAGAPPTSVAAEFYGVPFKEDKPLATSTATAFYGVPWKSRPDNAIEHTITIPSIHEEEQPLTARKASPVDEIDETYHVTLEQNASANLDRTQMWLSNQNAYMDEVLAEDEIVASFSELDGVSPVSPLTSPKKAVRFAEEAAEVKKRISPIHDGTFWEAFQHNKRSARARDVFQHRQMRAEAEQVRRNSASQPHASQLKGVFETAKLEVKRSSCIVNDGEDTEKKDAIARAERERSALEQMQSAAWHVEAQKELNGGTLLTSPIVATFKNRNDVYILDLAGQPHCSWAWDVAVTHPASCVYTTVASDVEAHVAESSLEGPDNHYVVAAPEPWNLPFDDGCFDVVSARNLYSNLRTYIPTGEISDEWDLTLKECMRVLKPGGYLEFDLLDAEIMNPQPAAQALGVEFAYNLKQRGYDPCSGKSFLPRLKRAGFRNIKRAWMILPLAHTNTQCAERTTAFPIKTPASAGTSFGLPETPDYAPPLTGSTSDVRAITGLVGARSWEQWMLKINAELERDDAKCLSDVAKALKDGGNGSGWRCLVGWAQKP